MRYKNVQYCRFLIDLYIKIYNTRGHAHFARSPLVIRLGDSRIRLRDSGYGEVLSLGWHYNYKIGTVALTEHYRIIFSLKIRFP